MALVIDNLSKFYGTVRGVEGVNLHIEKGDFFGFIGPNGAGKSTTIRTVLGLIHPTSGDIRIFGKSLKNEQTHLLKDIGYLPSTVNLYGDMRAGDLLKYASQFYSASSETRLNELAAWFDLDLKRKIQDLSYGNQKKVGIIQALIHEPKLLIMDEPTGGLDPLMQARFFERLHMENGQGTTIFFSSHTLSEVERHCKRVAVIREGKILDVSSVEALRKKQLKHIGIHISEGFHQKLKEQVELFEGVHNIETLENGGLCFDFNGVYQKLFELLANYPVENISMEEPSLEDIFMHYYKNGVV